MKSSTKMYSFLSVFLAAGTLPVAALETSDTDDSASQELTFDSIIVTATKRAILLQDTAMSISAFGDQTIQNKGLLSMDDYLGNLPNITLQNRGIGRTAIVVRGISIDPQFEGKLTGPTTAVYYGDTPVSAIADGSPTDFLLVDMQRVEVLRGPQGTLYGSGSLGGTVRYITAKPDLYKWSGQVESQMSFTEDAGSANTGLQGVINAPIVEDKLAVRAVLYRHQVAGYLDNVAANDSALVAAAENYDVAFAIAHDQDQAGAIYTGGRFMARWQPAEPLDIQVSYMRQDGEQDGFPEVQNGLPRTQQARLEISNLVPGSIFDKGERLDDRTEIINAVIEYDLGWANFYSASSWLDSHFDEIRDVRPAFALTSGLGGIPLPQKRATDTDGFTEEIRLASHWELPVHYLVGFYYENIDTVFENSLFFGGRADLNPFGSERQWTEYILRKNLKQYAFFGELSYELTKKVKLTAGMRRFNYDIVEDETFAGALFAGAPPAHRDTEDSGESLKFNISYTPNENMLFYGTMAEGFRIGTSNRPVVASICDVDDDGILDGTNVALAGLGKVSPDNLTSYEIGAKINRADNRLQIRAAVFRNDWTGLPILVKGDCIANVLVNAGKARTQGGEVEIHVSVIDSVMVELAGSYLDAELREDDPAVGGVTGDRLPASAEFSFSAGVQYDFDLYQHPAYGRIDYSYVGSYYNSFGTTGDKAGDYSLLGLRGGVSLDQFDVELFATNLLNSDALTWTDVELTGVGSRSLRLRPRSFGLTVRYSF